MQEQYIKSMGCKMKTKCKKCGYEWDYKGKAKYWTSCPRCRTNIDVRKLRSENVSST